MAVYLGDQKVRITDKSKTNLLDIFNRTEGKLTSGGSNTSIRSDIEFDKYYVGFLCNNYYYPHLIKEVKVDLFMKTIFVSSLSSGYGIGFPVKCEPSKTYTFSAEAVGISEQGHLRAGFYQEDGTYISFVINNAKKSNYITFTTPENCSIINLQIGLGKDQEALLTNICLVEGSFNGTTFTDYEPYNNQLKPPMIRANNLIPYPYYNSNKTHYGITFTPLDDGGIKVSGTHEANTEHSQFYVWMPKTEYPAGIYTLSGTKGKVSVKAAIIRTDGTNQWLSAKENGGLVITITEGDILDFIYVEIPSHITATVDEIVYPMLNEGSTPLPFRPYSEEPEYIY